MRSLAVVLSSVGIYGVVASFVGQRTAEIGVRMALGAGRAQVIGIVLGQSLVPVGAGLLLGLVGAVGLGRFVENLLFEVSPLDPLMLAGSVVDAGAGGRRRLRHSRRPRRADRSGDRTTRRIGHRFTRIRH